MSAPDGFALAEQLKDTLLSYLTSALPIGNHHSQLELGQAFYERWSSDLFAGPYVESLPLYEKIQSLDESFGDVRDRNSPDFRFGVLMNPAVTWADVENRHLQFKRVRDRIWPPGTDAAEEEEAETTTSRLWRRQQYKHQVDSFEHLVRQRRNLIVATATGSGKTECFLLPLLYSLLSEGDDLRRSPGVRALLVYPMNALVEDQMHRLRQILFWINLSCQNQHGLGGNRLARQLTFGRYTGNTPIDRNDHDPERQPSDEAMDHLGEVVYRSEMQNTPPDILVTNFTMLEYMLLRGDDQKLFQRPDLFQFLILDEIHTYTGTQGMEVALLLRRLRAFLETRAQSRLNFRVVGTSATLPSGRDARERTASFASTLFGVPLEAEDVLRPEPAAPPAPALMDEARRMELADGMAHLASLSPNLSAYLGLTEEAPPGEVPNEEWLRLSQLLHSVPAINEEENSPAVWRHLAELLDGSDILPILRFELARAESGCMTLDELSERLFGNYAESRHASTTLLLLVGAAHREGEPLVSLRFHHFVHEPSSAQICLRRGCDEILHDGWWSRLFVRHHSRCDQCDSLVYPVFLCRRCGFVYLQGWRRRSNNGVLGSDLVPEPDDADDQAIYERILFRPAGSAIPREAQEEGERRTLCLACGRWMVVREDPNFPAPEFHGCPSEACLDVISWQGALEKGVLEECLFCDQGWFEGQDVVTPPATSVYGTSTVLIEELSRGLETTGVRPYESKLISFSDSRQQAAQLAFRFQKTNREFTLRQLIWRIASNRPEGISSPDLLDELYRWTHDDFRLRRLVIDDDRRLADRTLLQRLLATLVFRESVTAYLTLEAQGLVRIDYNEDLLGRASDLVSGDRLLFDRLTPVQKRDLLRFLLDWVMRFRYTIDAAPGGSDVDWDRLSQWYVLPKSVVRMHAEAVRGELSFIVAHATRRNRPYNFFRRLVVRLNATPIRHEYNLEDLHTTLSGIFDRLLIPYSVPSSDPRRTLGAPLINYGNEAPDQARLKLNFDALSWSAIPDDSVLYRCDACGRLSPYSIFGVCPLRDCSGTLREIRASALDEERFAPVRHYRRLIRHRAIRPLRVEEHTAQMAARKRQLIEREFRRTGDESVDVVCGSTTFELGIDLGTIHAVFMSNLPPRVANYRQRAGRAGRRPGMVPFILSYVRQRPHDQYFSTRLRQFIAGPLPVPHLAITSREVQERHCYALLISSLLQDYSQATHQKMPLNGPAAEQFITYALTPHVQLHLELLLDDTSSALRRQFDCAFSDVQVVVAPRIAARELRGRLEALRQTYLAMRAGDGAISVLSDYGVLPSYAFPLYVDELRLNRIPRDRPPRCDLKLQRDRRIALREYTPGRVIVAGKTVIRSEGVWAGYELRPFQVCLNRDCRQMDFRENAAGLCLACGQARSQHVAVIPRAGFLGGLVESVADQDLELGKERGETYFDPANEPPPAYASAGRALEVATVAATVMEQSGFRPRMRQFNPRPVSLTELRLVERLEGDLAAPTVPPRRCLVRPVTEAEKQQARAFLLMHEFTTDIVRIKILDNEIGRHLVSSSAFVEVVQSNPDPARRAYYNDCLRRTLAEALVAAASVLLDIEQSELGVTLQPTANSAIGKELILFDTAPGGAGYSRQLAERIGEVFRTAEQILSVCNCGDSCYSCLRSYHNQIFHKRLNRNFVIEGLRSFNAQNWA